MLGDACHPMYPFMGQARRKRSRMERRFAACLVAAGDADLAETLQE